MLAALWAEHRGTNLDRIAVLERTADALLRRRADDDLLLEGARAAHKLAGSLGTFGLQEGTDAARLIEAELEGGRPDARQVAELVVELRRCIERADDSGAEHTDGVEHTDRATHPATVDEPRVGRSDETTTGGTVPAAAPPNDPTGAPVHAVLVSSDPRLVESVPLQAAARSAVVATLAAPGAELGSVHSRCVLLDLRDLPDPERVADVRRVIGDRVVLAIGDTGSLDERLLAARLGASSFVTRADTVGAILDAASRLVETDARRPGTLVAVTDVAHRLQPLADALRDRDVAPTVVEPSGALWDVLERTAADVVLLDASMRSCSWIELCRAVRADPRRRPVGIALLHPAPGATATTALIDAGGDLVVHAGAEAHDVGAQLELLVATARRARAAGPVADGPRREDPIALVERFVALAARRNERLTYALVEVDDVDELTRHHGGRARQKALEELGALLRGRFRQEDVVEPHADRGFSVLLYGTERDDIEQAMVGLLERFRTVPVGREDRGAGLSFSAGLAEMPTDGRTFAQLHAAASEAIGQLRSSGHHVGGATRVAADETVDVVVVEDDESIADVVVATFGARGVGVRHVDNGSDAAQLLTSGGLRARLVLLDLGLPGLNGFAVLQAMRDAGALASTNVVVLTARSSENETLRALELGAVDYITKPFSVPILLGRVQKYLGG